jgi:hypothetical protein
MSEERIKRQIIAALSHPEAEDGLYFNNLIIVHEEEERPIVEGEEAQVQAALDELVREGSITVTPTTQEHIYRLAH